MKMNLNDTIKLMQSNDYKERYKGEYYQVLIRYFKLKKMLEDWDADKLNFTPKCPRELLKQQLNIMSLYLNLLKSRSAFENISLDEIEV